MLNNIWPTKTELSGIFRRSFSHNALISSLFSTWEVLYVYNVLFVFVFFMLFLHVWVHVCDFMLFLSLFSQCLFCSIMVYFCSYHFIIILYFRCLFSKDVETAKIQMWWKVARITETLGEGKLFAEYNVGKKSIFNMRKTEKPA